MNVRVCVEGLEGERGGVDKSWHGRGKVGGRGGGGKQGELTWQDPALILIAASIKVIIVGEVDHVSWPSIDRVPQGAV